MAIHQGKRPSPRAQGIGRSTKNARQSKPRKQKHTEPKLPVSVVLREGKTTIRQLKGRRFVQFREFRGKRVAKVQFYTCSPNMHTISVHFEDKTVFYLEITPLFTVKPEYCNLKTGNVETIKEWPKMKCET